MKFNISHKIQRRMLTLVLTSTLCLLNISAQNNDFSPKHYAFMDKFSLKYSFYLDMYNSTNASISAAEDEKPVEINAYWYSLVSHISLLAPDSLVKEIWKNAYALDSDFMCKKLNAFPVSNFDREIYIKYPVLYLYFHTEKGFFGEYCTDWVGK